MGEFPLVFRCVLVLPAHSPSFSSSPFSPHSKTRAIACCGGRLRKTWTRAGFACLKGRSSSEAMPVRKKEEGRHSIHFPCSRDGYNRMLIPLSFPLYPLLQASPPLPPWKPESWAPTRPPCWCVCLGGIWRPKHRSDDPSFASPPRTTLR